MIKDNLIRLNELYNKNDKLQKFVHTFFYSDYYIALVAAVVFIAWISKSAVFGFVGLIGLTCVTLVLVDDILPVLAPLFMAACMIFTDQVADFLFMWPMFIPLGLSIAYFAIRNLKRLRLGKMLLPQIVVSIVLLLAGVGVTTGSEYIKALPSIAFLGLGLLFVYMLVYQYIKVDANRDYGLFVAKVLAYLGLVATIQTAINVGVLLDNGIEYNQLHNAISVGWGISNNIATILLLTAPMTLYLSTRYRNGFFYAAIGIFQYIGIFLTLSRGGMLAAVITLPFALFFSIKRAYKPKRQIVLYAIIIALVAVFYGIVHSDINNMILSMFSKGTSSSGRAELYKEAWGLFKTYPAFGRGFGYVGENYPIDVIDFYWFHSTLFQVLGSTGTIGLLGYAFYYFGRFRIIFKNIKNTFNIFVLIAVIAFEGYAMIDTATFVPFPQMTLVLVLTIATEYANAHPKAGEVDCYNRTSRYSGAIAFAEQFTDIYTREEPALLAA